MKKGQKCQKLMKKAHEQVQQSIGAIPKENQAN